MKKVLQVLGTMTYGMISSWLIWLFFWWITPYVMSASWLLLILYLFLAGGLLSMIAAFVAGMLSVPMSYLMKDNMAAKVVYTILCLIWGYSSCALPFHLDISFGIRQWILALMITGTALCIFASLIAVSYKED